MYKFINIEICEEYYKRFQTPAHVIAHCMAVSSVGVKIGKAINKGLERKKLNIELIKYAGLLHDMMRTSENHGEVAADFLNDEGYEDIANVIRPHMHYELNSIENVDETDILCLADRLVMENIYVGLDKRFQYIIDKPGKTPERTAYLLTKKKETEIFIRDLEKIVKLGIDEICGNDNLEEENE